MLEDLLLGARLGVWLRLFLLCSASTAASCTFWPPSLNALMVALIFADSTRFSVTRRPISTLDFELVVQLQDPMMVSRSVWTTLACRIPVPDHERPTAAYSSFALLPGAKPTTAPLASSSCSLCS